MHSKSIEQIAEELKTNKKTGLTEVEAASRLKQNGKNVIQEEKVVPGFLRFLKQFANLLIIILIVASALQIAIAIIEHDIKEYISAGLIWTIILVNTIIGYVQEGKAQKAIAALRNQTKPYAKVLRDGQVIEIKQEDLVLGDVVLLEAGDIVPADLRLFKVAGLQIEEAALTGESVPSIKNTKIIDVAGVVLGDMTNMAFAGTIVQNGRGSGIVVAAAMATEVGKIAGELKKQKPPKTPLTKRLAKTSHVIALIVAVVALAIFITNLILGDPVIDSMMMTIAIAVCAVPEGLPICISSALALATKRMSKKKAIMRNLPSVETLGSTDIICSDKTGTITLNKMTVQSIFTLKIDKTNIFEINDDVDALDNFKEHRCFDKLMQTMTLCNDAKSRYENGILSTIGDPTETALIHCAHKFGFSLDYMRNKYERIDEVPFNSDRKMMSTINDVDGEAIMFCKGAPASILKRCTKIFDDGKVRDITPEDIKTIESTAKKFARKALRVLGYACKEFAYDKAKGVSTDDENELTFIGLTGMIDPPREEVFESVKICKEAGIKVVMITGDHMDTAFAIAKQIGIVETEDEVMTGDRLNEIDDKELCTIVNQFAVFARVNPEHKVRIVKAFKSHNKVVAMTGDGVNDAASIKAADIGIGMGITGTEVTKKVADMVLTDDNFATIVGAVEEGRRTLANIKKIIVYLFAIAIAELFMLSVMNFARIQFFGPILILWVNIAGATFPALAMGSLHAENNVMHKKSSNSRSKSLFRGQTGLSIIVYAAMTILICMSVYFLTFYGFNLSNIESVTTTFLTLTVLESILPLNLISNKESFFSKNTFKTKWLNIAVASETVLGIIPIVIPFAALQKVMGITMLNGIEWLIGIAFALLILPMAEIYKYILRRRDLEKKAEDIKKTA